MTRVLIVTIGTHGDVFPFLAVGRVLAARGVDVHVLANPHYEEDVRIAGLGFVPLGELMPTRHFIQNYGVMHPAFGLMRTIRMVHDGAPLMVSRTREVVTAMRPDVIFAHHNCFGGADVAEETSTPCALALLSPGVMFSREDPVAMGQSWSGRTGRWFSSAMMRFGEWTMLPMMNSMHNRARRKCGLAPVHDAARAAWQAGDRLIAMWSEAFRAPQSDDPPHTRTAGFAFYDGDPAARLPRDLDEFLGAGEPPMLFCLGTTAVHVPGNFYGNAIKAAKELGRRALLLAGPDAPAYDRPAEGVRAFDYAPLTLIADRCSVGVIHGGMGTTAQMLRAGKPMLIAPFAFDQFNNGVRVHALGVGETLPSWRLKSARMTELLDRLLRSEEIHARAAAISERIRHEDGATRAAELVSELASRA